MLAQNLLKRLLGHTALAELTQTDMLEPVRHTEIEGALLPLLEILEQLFRRVDGGLALSQFT